MKVITSLAIWLGQLPIQYSFFWMNVLSLVSIKHMPHYVLMHTTLGIPKWKTPLTLLCWPQTWFRAGVHYNAICFQAGSRPLQIRVHFNLTSSVSERFEVMGILLRLIGIRYDYMLWDDYLRWFQLLKPLSRDAAIFGCFLARNFMEKLLEFLLVLT